MSFIIVVLDIFWNILLLAPKLFLAFFPLYKTLSDFKQNLIAAIFGMSPVIIWLVIKVFKIIKHYLEEK